VTLQPEGEYDAAALDVAVEVIRARVDSIGVAEPEIIRQGDTVVVNLPGVEDQQRALDLVGRTGELLLRPVLAAGVAPSDATAGLDDGGDPTKSALLLDEAGIAYVVGPSRATGNVFESDARPDVQSGAWSVVVSLRPGADGEDPWNALATLCYGRDQACPTGQIAMVLDGVVISAPTVQEPTFTGGTVQITGDFAQEEATDLAKILEFGAVPVRFGVSQAQTVSATLGSDSLRAALLSGAAGIALVLLLLFLYYRLMAVVIVAGLGISVALLWSLVSLLSRTNGLALSLSGIAGIVVSIGISVDSYIVFFERVKEELRVGRTLRNSAPRSFASAWRTVVAADTVSFLGAIVLWWLTVGSVRGFAFFLGVSALTDLVVTWCFTRSTVLLLSRSRRLAGRKVLGVRTAVPA
jgi:preprotein translocase subunit SecD